MCAWDKTQPQNTTKLRNLGDVIRPNWVAIEQAEDTFLPIALNLADRTPLGVANDPTAIAASVIAYSKQDGAGKPQAYTIDPDSVITQLTGGSLTAANPGKLILPNGLVMIWGTGAATAAFVVKDFPTFGILVGFPNNCFHISGSATGGTKSIGFNIVSKTQYSVKCDSDTSNYTYFAIGN